MLIEYPNVDMMNCWMLAVFCNNHALSIHLFLKYCTSVQGIKCYFCSIPFNLFRNPSIPSTCCTHVSETVAMKSNWILVNFFCLLYRKSNSRFIRFDCYEAETLLQCKAKLSWSKLRERSVYLYLYLGIYDFQVEVESLQIIQPNLLIHIKILHFHHIIFVGSAFRLNSGTSAPAHA